jgi:hypothetical protein
MAELLRSRGLHLVQSIAAARGDFSFLLLTSAPLEAQASQLIGAGYRLLGQRWVGIRAEEGRVHLLHLPGLVRRTAESWRPGAAGPRVRWIDLEGEFLGASQHHAYCNAILLPAPGRFARPQFRELSMLESAEALKHAWPATHLPCSARPNQFHNLLSRRCRCFRVELPRNPVDLLRLLDEIRIPALSVHLRRNRCPSGAIPRRPLVLEPVKSRERRRQIPPTGPSAAPPAQRSFGPVPGPTVPTGSILPQT